MIVASKPRMRRVQRRGPSDFGLRQMPATWRGAGRRWMVFRKSERRQSLNAVTAGLIAFHPELAQMPNDRRRSKRAHTVATNVDQHAHRLADGASDDLQERD